MTPTLLSSAAAILATPAPADKIAKTHGLVAAWRAGTLAVGTPVAALERPARPARPVLKLPRDMPRRRSGFSEANRIALLHALAHIELNALDLAWDMVARFGTPDRPRGFFDDWLTVADEEARHHGLLAARLAAFGAAYGDHPAHDGLWEAASTTAHDLLARLAIVPLVLEARGLDVTPAMIDNLNRAGDTESAAILDIIYRDEIGHVAIGTRWFTATARARGLDPEQAYHSLVRIHFKGGLKPPFNHAARTEAGMSSGFYEGLVGV